MSTVQPMQTFDKEGGFLSGGILKIVYLFGGLFILLVTTTTWLLGDNAFLQPRGVIMNAL